MSERVPGYRLRGLWSADLKGFMSAQKAKETKLRLINIFYLNEALSYKLLHGTLTKHYNDSSRSVRSSYSIIQTFHGKLTSQSWIGFVDWIALETNKRRSLSL